MDDDIICLSSDNDDSSQSSQKNSFVNGSRAPLTLQMGGFNSNASNSQSISNGHTSSTVVKTKKEPQEQDIVTLNSDDDSDFEIEYSSQGREQNSNGGGGGTQTVDDSDDDDIQVLEENIKVNHQHTPDKLKIKEMNERRKSYQENQQNKKKEVNLSVPVVKGLTSGVYREPKETIGEVAVAAGASGDGNSSSQDAVVIDEDVVMEEEEEEDDDEVDGDGDKNSNCSSSSGSGSGGDKPNDEDVDYKAKSRKSLIRLLNEFCARGKEKKKALMKARQRTMDAYEKTVDLNMTVHRRLHERIEHDLEIIRSSSDEQWKTLNDLLSYMKPEILTRDQIKTEDQIWEEREAQKMELRRKYEKELARIQRKIKRLEETEVDWDADDDHNSAYMLQEKYKAKLVKAYYTLCTLSKCSHFTGRPTQTKITLKKHNAASNYPEIDVEVEKFVNKMGFLEAPDYTDILETIQNVNKSKSLELNEEKVMQIAQKMFENIVKIIKKRREKDFKISMLTTLLPTPRTSSKRSADSNTPSTSGSSGDNPSVNDDYDDPEELEKQLQDPADTDPELLAKLEENVKHRKSESEVIDKYARIVPTEVVNGGNDSGDGETDNEDDDEEEEDYQAEERQLSKNHQVAELTEDEDDLPENVGFDGSTLTGGRRISCDSVDDKANENERTEEEEDDDSSSSNDGKNTGESEMDTDLDNIIEGRCVGKEAQVETTSNVPPPSTATPVDIVVSDVEKMVEEEDQSKKANDTIELTDADTAGDDEDDKDIGEPPAKRMRADENCNEEREIVATKPVAVTDSEEIAVISVPVPTAPAPVVENKGDSLV